MVHASSWWKISPGKEGKYWNDWLQNNYCILFHWEEQDYFDQTDMNLQQNYSSSEEFLKITGFVGRPPNDWRMQLRNFVWGVKEGDILFLYKKGFFIAWGMVDMNGKYYYNREGHSRKIVWKISQEILLTLDKGRESSLSFQKERQYERLSNNIFVLPLKGI